VGTALINLTTQQLGIKSIQYVQGQNAKGKKKEK
jgi:hypothetical protein